MVRRVRLLSVSAPHRSLRTPARLEPATSWFVVVVRKIDQGRFRTTKIRWISDLSPNDHQASNFVYLDITASVDGVASQSASQPNRERLGFRPRKVEVRITMTEVSAQSGGVRCRSRVSGLPSGSSTTPAADGARPGSRYPPSLARLQSRATCCHATDSTGLPSSCHC
jgi:hypothetical protein